MISDPESLILVAVLFMNGFFCAVSMAMLFSKRFFEEFGSTDYMMLLGSAFLLASFLLNIWPAMDNFNAGLFRRDPTLLLVALPAVYVVWLIVKFVLINPLGRNFSEDDWIQGRAIRQHPDPVAC